MISRGVIVNLGITALNLFEIHKIMEYFGGNSALPYSALTETVRT